MGVEGDRLWLVCELVSRARATQRALPGPRRRAPVSRCRAPRRTRLSPATTPCGTPCSSRARTPPSRTERPDRLHPSGARRRPGSGRSAANVSGMKPRSRPLPDCSNRICAGVSSSSGTTRPVTAATSGSARETLPSALSQFRSATTSSSVKAMISPVAARYAAVAGRRDPWARLAHHPRSRDIHRRRVPGAVIDDDHLVVGVIQLPEAFDAPSQLSLALENAGNDDARPGERRRAAAGVAGLAGPCFAELATQLGLEFGGGDSRAVEGHLDDAKRTAGPAGEDERAGVGRLVRTRAVEVAERVGDVDDGDAYRVGHLHHWQLSESLQLLYVMTQIPFHLRSHSRPPGSVFASAGLSQGFVEVAEVADELGVGRVIDRAGDDRDGVVGQRGAEGRAAVRRPRRCGSPWRRSSPRRRRSRGCRTGCRRCGRSRGPSSS